MRLRTTAALLLAAAALPTLAAAPADPPLGVLGAMEDDDDLVEGGHAVEVSPRR